jgi:hypothetical protein
MLVIKSDTTGLIADYNDCVSKVLQLFSSSVSTVHSNPTKNSHLFPWVSMLCISVQIEVLRLSLT